MKNKSLKTDLKEIISNPSNVIIKKGGVSMYSIEIEFIEETTFSSYVYYDRVDERDADFQELESLLNV